MYSRFYFMPTAFLCVLLIHGNVSSEPGTPETGRLTHPRMSGPAASGQEDAPAVAIPQGARPETFGLSLFVALDVVDSLEEKFVAKYSIVNDGSEPRLISPNLEPAWEVVEGWLDSGDIRPEEVYPNSHYVLLNPRSPSDRKANSVTCEEVMRGKFPLHIAGATDDHHRTEIDVRIYGTLLEWQPEKKLFRRCRFALSQRTQVPKQAGQTKDERIERGK